MLPHISDDLPDFARAVISLAGVSPRTQRWHAESTIGEHGYDLFRNAGAIREGYSWREAWMSFLQENTRLAPQAVSRVASYIIAQRLAAPRSAPNFGSALLAMANDLTTVYKTNLQEIAPRFLLADNTVMPPPTKDRSTTLKRA